MAPALGLGLFLGLLGLLWDPGGATRVLHSLRYLHMAVSEPSPGLPQFMSTGYLDGIPFTRCDSEQGQVVPLTQWIKDGADQGYWNREIEICVLNQHVYARGLDTLRNRYNQSGGHLRRVFRGAKSESLESKADPPLVPSAPGDEKKNEQNDYKSPAVLTAQPEYSEPALLEKEQEQIALSEEPFQTQGELFPAWEQEEQLRQQEEELQENGQIVKAEPQAELPEVHIPVMAVKRRHKEALTGVQEEMNFHHQRDHQQNWVTDDPLANYFACFLRNLKDQLQENEARMKALDKRLEEEIKMIREKHNAWCQAARKQVEVMTSHLPSCKDFQQMTGNKGLCGRSEAQELSQPEMLKTPSDCNTSQASVNPGTMIHDNAEEEG